MLFNISYFRFKGIAGEAIWVLVGNVVAMSGTLALLRVLTEFLSPQEYGRLALGLTYVAFFGQLVFGALGQGIIRYYSVALNQKDLQGYVMASKRLLLLGTAITFALSALVALAMIYFDQRNWLTVIPAAMTLAILNGYYSTLNGIQNTARNRSIVAFQSGIEAWVKIGVALVFLFWLSASSILVLIAFSISTSMVILCQIIIFHKTFNISIMNACSLNLDNWTSRIWKYSQPFAIWGFFTWMQIASGRWSLGIYGTTSEVGYYAVLVQLGYTPVVTLLSMAMTFFTPIIFQRAGDASSASANKNVDQIIWKLTSTVLFITLVGVLFAAFTHQPIFLLLVEIEYRWVSYLMPWVVSAAGVFAAGQIISLKLMSELKVKKLILPKIVTAIIGLGLNMFGAASAGIEGVVFGMNAFSLSYLVWMILIARRRRAWMTK